MKLSIKDLRRIIREEHKKANRFLHGEDPNDSEGAMAKSKLGSLAEMSSELTSLLDDDDQLPGWVQDHISVAHENLRQVHGYLAGVTKR